MIIDYVNPSDGNRADCGELILTICWLIGDYANNNKIPDISMAALKEYRDVTAQVNFLPTLRLWNSLCMSKSVLLNLVPRHRIQVLLRFSRYEE